MDLDTIVMNHSIPLETFLDPRYDLVISRGKQLGMLVLLLLGLASAAKRQLLPMPCGLPCAPGPSVQCTLPTTSGQVVLTPACVYIPAGA